MVRPAGEPLAPGRLSDAPDPTWRFMMQRGLPTFAVEGFAPVLLFYGVWKITALAPAIVAATALSGAIVWWQARQGRGGGLAVVAAIFLLIQAAVGLASHSATVYLAQPVVVSACWGLAYLGSVAVGRPLVGVFANVWYPFPPEFRASEQYRREFGLQSVVWGMYCLARAGMRLAALLGAGIGTFVLVSLLTGAPVFFVLVLWGIWHARRSFQAVSRELAVSATG
jgi:intracellular septation protein A